MPYHLYKTCRESEDPHWFGIRVVFEDDYWVSSCSEVDARGGELLDAGSTVPKFYGVTERQAHRRMLDALEDRYDLIVPSEQGA